MSLNSSPSTLTYRLGNEKLCRITLAAATKLKSLLTRQGRPQGALRIAIIGGGCSGLQYKMDLVDGPVARDILIRFFVEPADADEVQGVDGAQRRSVLNVVDGASTGATKQFAAPVGSCKKSIESQEVRIVIDPKSALFVSGSELDYSDDLQKGGFKVTNPNAVAHCSCGESFSA